MKKFNVLCLSTLLLCATSMSFASADKKTEAVDKSQFITTKETRFSKNGSTYYVVGSNLWYGGYLGAATKVGDRVRLVKELDNLKALGINNLRVLAVSEKSDLNSAVHPSTNNRDGTFDEDLLVGLDFFMAEMAKRDMTVVLYLNNFWQWSGGMTQYLSWLDGKPVNDPNVTNDWDGFAAQSATFYTNKKANQHFRDVIKKIVTRVNTVTGKRYIDDTNLMSWQLANEPRVGGSKVTDKDKAIYKKWINDTAKYIRSLDANHMISTGSEGLKGSAEDEKLFADVHASPYIDYLTYHLWVKNWFWFDSLKPEETWEPMLVKAKSYLNSHIDVAQKVKKPIVLEEFGLDRDGAVFDIKATTHYRDRYYREVFELLYNRAKAGDAIAGYNFWAWNGSARAANANYLWKTGDDYMGDPPQEAQGLYGVFDSDLTSILLIKEYSDKMHALPK